MLAGKRVLVVDDDSATVYSLVNGLRHETNHSVETARDGRQALDLHQAQPFDLILLNHLMPRMTGVEMLADLRRRGDRVPVVMHSACPREQITRLVEGLELDAFVQTPFDRDEYIEAARNVMATSADRRLLPR
jgi:two-component system response regulator TctD